jgi:opacity protein-like surface antigen
MKLRISIVIAVVLLTALVCAAQTPTPVAPAYSKFELSVGYDRSWNNITFNDLAASNLKRTFLSGLNGADIGATYNFNKTLGLKADFSFSTQSGNLNTSGKNYLLAFGPVIKKHGGRFNPFGELLVGATHQTQQGFGFNFTTGQSALAAIAGGGLDLKATPHLSVRLGEFDYVWTALHADHPTDFLVVSSRQNNFRYVGGIVFTF